MTPRCRKIIIVSMERETQKEKDHQIAEYKPTDVLPFIRWTDFAKEDQRISTENTAWKDDDLWNKHWSDVTNDPPRFLEACHDRWGRCALFIPLVLSYRSYLREDHVEPDLTMPSIAQLFMAVVPLGGRQFVFSAQSQKRLDDHIVPS